jgi:hypothetical protein
MNDLANARFNAMLFGYAGNQLQETILVGSDLTYGNLASSPSIFGTGPLFGGCAYGSGWANCPILTDGQTYSGIPLWNYDGQLPQTLAVTFTDRGDVAAAVPEPETYAMLLAGLGLLGFMAKRRKQKEASVD